MWFTCPSGSVELFWASTKLSVNWRESENNTLQRWKNMKEMIINHKRTRTVKDGGDWHRLQTTKLKSLAKLFKPFKITVYCRVFKFLRRSVDAKNLMRFQCETSFSNLPAWNGRDLRVHRRRVYSDIHAPGNTYQLLDCSKKKRKNVLSWSLGLCISTKLDHLHRMLGNIQVLCWLEKTLIEIFIILVL